MKKKANLRKALALLLATLLTLSSLLFLASCKKDNGEDNDSDATSGTSGGGGTTTEATPKVLELIAGGKSDYSIIIADEPDAKVLNAVNLLISAIKDYTGATLSYKRDYLPRGEEPDANAKEILVGETNRPETAEATKELGMGEYTISVVGNKLVVCGGDVSSTVAAVDYFVMKLIKGNSQLKYGMTDGSFSFSETQNYYHANANYIKKITIGGTELSEMKIVYPKDSNAAYLVALQLKKHISIYYGATLELIDDSTAASGKEVLIGKTSRTTLTPPIGKITIGVTEKGLEASSDSIFGYPSLAYSLCYTVFKQSLSKIELTSADKWESGDGAPQNLKNTSDLRIMYHNIWGYLNADQTVNPNPVANRSRLAMEVYAAYQPDVLCFEEMSNSYRTSSPELMNWLSDSGYTEVCYHSNGGTGNPIFYKASRFECLEKGYNKSRGGDKGTTWCVLKDKTSGKTFAVTNSHFAADTNAGDDHSLGIEYRTKDAQCLLGVVNKIKNSYPTTPIICGGDYNAALTANSSIPEAKPITTLLEGGLKEIRDVAETWDDLSPYNTSIPYDSDIGMYPFAYANPTTAINAIDHIMIGGNESAVKVNGYSVAHDRVSATTSDHLPHFTDITFR